MTDETTNLVSIKIPPFWPADPALWFAQIESQFATRKITSQQTKFDHVISSLTPEYATEIRDLILNPPTSEQYDTLKRTLIQRTTISDQKKIQKLLSIEELGDKKPSQLLRQVQQLMGDRQNSTDNMLVKQLFLRHLPTNV